MTTVEPDWRTCPGPAVCVALIQARDSSKDALIVAQAQTIDRLTGGRGYEPPPVAELVEPQPAPKPKPCIEEALREALADEGVYRKPPRVAAPRLVEYLAAAGIHLVQEPGA